MIGKLKGVIENYNTENGCILIDVGGVGYEVFCSQRTIANLPKNGEQTEIIIETQMREDKIQLLGFENNRQREWFRLLSNVQGVGPKLALSIFSTFETHELEQAIAFEDQKMIERAQGAGPKIARRIVSELKDKMPENAQFQNNNTQQHNNNQNQTFNQALTALVNLGFNRNSAGQVLQKNMHINQDLSLEDHIKSALKELTQ